MKRLIGIFLITALLLSLCACGGSEAANGKGKDSAETTAAPQPEGLQVGFSRVDVTPDFSINISGGDSKNRKSSGYRDPICVTCVAIGSGESMVLVYTLDYITMGEYADPAQEMITEAMEKYPMEVNYKKIVLGEMVFA